MSKAKIVGLAGALGLGIFGTKEAEAFPLKNVVKGGARKVLGSISSASERLKGYTLEGKVIKEVRKGRGNWRVIIFEDGTEQSMTKDYVTSLCANKGTHKYVNKFSRKGSLEGKIKQAEKSLDIRLKKAKPLMHKPLTHARRQHDYDRLKELNVKQADVIGVWKDKRYLTMPKEYAELLESQGKVRIDRSKTAKFKREVE